MPSSTSGMPRGLRTLLVAGSAVAVVGRRVQSSQAAALALEQAPKLFASPVSTVCGGSAVRTFMSVEARLIPWSEVDAVADDFLRTQAAQIARLQAEVEQLKVEIPLREKKEALKPISPDVVTKAVTDAATAAFGTLAVAKASQCGAAPVRPRPSRTAFADTVANFQASITEALKGGTTVSASSAVRGTCEAVLDFKAKDATSSCGELCQQIATAAQTVSDKMAGALALGGKASDQLRKELEDKSALLRQMIVDLEQCKQLKSDVAVFRAQLQGLTEDVTDKHAKLRSARETLVDAQYDLADAADALALQGTATNKATEVLQGAGKLADEALAKFQAADSRGKAVRSNMEASTKELEKAKTDLRTAKDAADGVDNLKSAVSDTMLKMVLFFNEGVRQPIRNLGLGEAVVVDNLFPGDVTQLQSEKNMRQSLDALSNFCKQPETTRVLAAVAAKDQDVSALCAVGDPAVLARDIDASVVDRVSALKDSLANVQSWLCPFRGQPNMTLEVASGFVKQGEPAGLREVITAFSQTTYYQRYLQNWQLKGRFLQLYAALQLAVQQAQVTHESATTKLQAVTVELQQAEQAMAESQAALKQAVDSKAVAQGKQQEAQALLETMTASTKALDDKLKLLEAAVAEAERRWNAAKLSLEATHRQGISLVQLLEEMEASAGALAQ